MVSGSDAPMSDRARLTLLEGMSDLWCTGSHWPLDAAESMVVSHSRMGH